MAKLFVITALTLAVTVQLAIASDEVRVTEQCTASGCYIVISGPKSICLEKARSKAWETGLEAAVAIRNCLDLAVARASEQVAKGGR